MGLVHARQTLFQQSYTPVVDTRFLCVQSIYRVREASARNSCDPQGIESLLFLRLFQSLTPSLQTNAPDLAKNFQSYTELVAHTSVSPALWFAYRQFRTTCGNSW